MLTTFPPAEDSPPQAAEQSPVNGTAVGSSSGNGTAVGSSSGNAVCHASQDGKHSGVTNTTFQISLEVLWFAYHLLSKWSAMDPNDAVHLIKECLAEDWDVLTFARAHQGDHATDALDPEYPYNRKIENVATILKLVPRMQEIKLGDVKFRDTNSYFRKRFMEGDFDRDTTLICELLYRRKDATVAYARTLNVDDLLEFTEPLRDPVHGGTNFPLKGFLYTVLPFWENLAKDLTPAPIQVNCPIGLAVKDQVDQILEKGNGNIARAVSPQELS